MRQYLYDIQHMLEKDNGIKSVGTYYISIHIVNNNY